ncbi:hypothetical protein [Reinekea sp. G2M2-21]|uniref:hypothetical protein n=1 Tax=Reinekea sp. G2M2-21 TaxID=2788942 RepID=UPI0018AA1FF2|nr:hypothetical protein [Reinekea sp. G2M2-21]
MNRINGMRLSAATFLLLLLPVIKVWALPFSNQMSVDLFAGFYPLFSGFVFWVLVYGYIGRFGWHILWQQLFGEAIFIIMCVVMLFYCHRLLSMAGYQITL